MAKTPTRKWEYHIGATTGTAITSASEMVEWLDQKDAEGWEFVGIHLAAHSRGIQEWHVFRRPYRGA